MYVTRQKGYYFIVECYDLTGSELRLRGKLASFHIRQFSEPLIACGTNSRLAVLVQNLPPSPSGSWRQRHGWTSITRLHVYSKDLQEIKGLILDGLISGIRGFYLRHVIIPLYQNHVLMSGV